MGKKTIKKKAEKDDGRFLVRAVCLILAVVVIISGFSIFFSAANQPEEGFLQISAHEDSEIPEYDSWVTYGYYMNGTSKANKKAAEKLSAPYSASLGRAYRLLDPEKEYEGYANIATLNARRGETVAVSDELFGILKEASEITERDGFSMFAGALYAEWDSVFEAKDRAKEDPALNADRKARIEKIAAAVNDSSNFTFEIVNEEAKEVRFDVSEDYKALEAELGITAPALDLNMMREPYMTQIIASSMKALGYSDAYILTDDFLNYQAIGYIYSNFAASDEEDGGHYAVNVDGSKLLRHRFIDVKTGDINSLIKTSSVYSANPELLAETRYASLHLAGLKTEEEIKAFKEGMSIPEISIEYTLQ